MSKTDRVAAQAVAMAEANTILRKIAAHVPARVWIEAKEKGNYILDSSDLTAMIGL